MPGGFVRSSGTGRLVNGLEDDVKRLAALLSQAGEAQQRMNSGHAQAMAARDQDLRQAEERRTAQERRLLAEVWIAHGSQ